MKEGIWEELEMNEEQTPLNNVSLWVKKKEFSIYSQTATNV